MEATTGIKYSFPDYVVHIDIIQYVYQRTYIEINHELDAFYLL